MNVDRGALSIKPQVQPHTQNKKYARKGFRCLSLTTCLALRGWDVILMI